MDSALRPREIQARIRAGESVEDVATAAGVTAESLAAFATPVLAERDHVARLAQSHAVRRRGEVTSHRLLADAVTEHLLRVGYDRGSLTWDAWKLADRRWQVVARFRDTDGEAQEAAFTYDQSGRFSLADDDLARELIDDQPPPAVVSVPVPEAAPPAAAPAAAGAAPTEDAEGFVAPIAAEDYADDDSEDAYSGGELAEVDGVYDIVPPASELDVLYDMLSSFDEDSVKIYAGLIAPTDAPRSDEALDAAAASEPEPPQPEPEAAEQPAAAAPTEAPAAESAQPTLLGDPDSEPTQTVRKRGRRKRASVPSWDEIMFGAPRKTDR